MATAVAEEDALWAAVADPTRRRVLDSLLEQGEATTTTLAEGLPVTRQAVAKHLVVLNRVGLLEGRRHGREMRYTVRPERLDDAAEAMARVARQWDRRLARIKRLAESVQAEAGIDFKHHRQGESNDRSHDRNS
jgi:ArsR family transcriptional regulator, cadmium/lead-responsive transcriptional repressor